MSHPVLDPRVAPPFPVAALPVLRRRANAAPASFRAPGGVPIALVVVALASWLLWNATFRELRDTAIAVAVGLAAYTLSRLSASSWSR